MQLWEGFETTKANILVLGATNKKEQLDDAVLRRFSLQYEVRTAAVCNHWQPNLLCAGMLHHPPPTSTRQGVCGLVTALLSACPIHRVPSLAPTSAHWCSCPALSSVNLSCPRSATDLLSNPRSPGTLQVQLPSPQQREAILRLTLRRHALETDPALLDRQLWPLIFGDPAVRGSPCPALGVMAGRQLRDSTRTGAIKWMVG